MLEELLKNWNYSKAVTLYQAHGSNGTFKAMLARGYSLANELMLKEEIRKLKLPDAAITVPVQPPKPAVRAVIGAGDDVPAEIKALESHWREDYKRASVLHQQLDIMQTDEQRLTAALRILDDFENKIHPAWDALDHWKATGQLPVQQVEGEKVLIKVDVNDREKLITRRNNLRTYISNKNNSHREADLEEWKKERDAIDELLKKH